MLAFWYTLATLRKRKVRTVTAVGGVTVGVGTLFALLSVGAGIQRALSQALDAMGAHILVLPIGCPYALTLALTRGVDTLEYLDEDLLPQVLNHPNVKMANPVVVGKVLVNGEQFTVYGTTKDYLVSRGWPGSAFEGALVGAEAARRLEVEVGDVLNLSFYSQETLPVLGVLPRTGGQQDLFVFVPLKVAQRLLGLEGKLSAILVQVKEVREVTATRQALGRLPFSQAVPPSEVFDMLVGLYGTVQSNLILVTGIAIAVATLITFNTMVMAVYERRREIGILRAIGTTRSQVFFLFVREAAVLSLIAGLMGIGGGYLATLLLPQTTGFGLEARPVLSPAYVGLCLLVALVVGLAAGAYPAFRAAQIQPISVLREP